MIEAFKPASQPPPYVGNNSVPDGVCNMKTNAPIVFVLFLLFGNGNLDAEIV